MSVTSSTVEHKLLPLEWITENPIEKSSAAYSAPNAGTIASMAESMKNDGQIHPILVYADKSEKDRYKIVAGRKRIAAAKKLGWDLIRAEILSDDLTAEEIESLVIAENAFRHHPHEKIKQSLAIKRWSEIWEKRKNQRPLEIVAKKPPDSPIIARPPDAPVAADPVPEKKASTWKPRAEETEEEKSARIRRTRGNAKKALAIATGMSERSAARRIAIAKKLTEEQLGILEAVGASQADLEEIVAIEDEAQRAAAVNLLASGMPVAQAVAQASPESKTAKAVAEATITDAEWLETHCSEIRARLANHKAFDISAILYRQLQPARVEFAKKAATPLSEAVSSGESIGMFGRMVRKIAAVSHPRDWLVCGKCQGSGRSLIGPSRFDNGPCVSCGGDGFKAKEEQ